MDVSHILGKLEEQGRHLNDRLDRIERKVDVLTDNHLAFKWKVMGAAMFCAFLVSLLVELARAQ
jgi:hypothetical protein